MDKIAVLSFSEAIADNFEHNFEHNFEQGFAVTLQIGSEGDRFHTSLSGQLPPIP